MLGAIFAAGPADRFGRGAGLRVLAVLYVVAALGCAWAWAWYSFVAFRFIGGLAIGGSSVIGPMYIAEIAPTSRRGRLVAFFQLNVVAVIAVHRIGLGLPTSITLGPTRGRAVIRVCALTPRLQQAVRVEFRPSLLAPHH